MKDVDLGTVEEGDREEDEAARTARREGGGLAARFFRWKDEVLAPMPELERAIRAAHRKGLPDVRKLLDSSAKLDLAMTGLKRAPDDEGAFGEAVARLDDMLSAFEAEGCPRKSSVRP